MLTPCHGRGSWLPLSANLAQWPEEDYPRFTKEEFVSTRASAPLADLQKALVDLETNLWIQEDIERLKVQMITVNREYGLWTLSTIDFAFRKSGRLVTGVHSKSQWLSTFGAYPSDWGAVYVLFAAGVVWFVLQVAIVVGEVKEIWETWRRTRDLSKTVQEYVAFWNLVDWTTAVSATVWVVIVLRVMELRSNLVYNVREDSTDATLYELTETIMGFQELLEFNTFM